VRTPEEIRRAILEERAYPTRPPKPLKLRYHLHKGVVHIMFWRDDIECWEWPQHHGHVAIMKTEIVQERPVTCFHCIVFVR
jgi:hypothetical protein